MKVLLICCAIVLAAEASPHNRLIGGGHATKGDWPFVAAVEYSGGAGWNHIGAGGIISNRYVLTAAYVVNGLAASSVRVVVGANNRAISDEEDLITAETITVHSSYNAAATPRRNDIALIRTSRNIIMNAFVSTIELALVDDPHDGEACWFAGWGSRTYGSTAFYSILQQKAVTVMLNANCTSMTSGVVTQIHATHMCSYESANNTATCNGDEGGPLSCLHSSVWHFAGINIWSYFDGTGCDRTRPSAYTRVERYLDWIATESGIIPPQ
eukprot:GHVU01153068.1.p1 GENE.GHVU01153068.1~~GHVU01153068.1.p1  ORF type:complete len:269 (+),score=5.97 GHVU01153068.1:72-878(+)